MGISRKFTISDRWAKVIRELNIDLSKPVNYVSMVDVEKHGEKEIRHMLSIDGENRNPVVFRQFGVFVLPVSLREVVIIHGNGFHDLEEIKQPIQRHKTEFSFPVSLRNSTGETGFLEYAFYTNLISRFTQRPRLSKGFSAKGSASFSFRVDGNPRINAQGVRIEVDSSYEDEERYYLAEAKYKIRRSFTVRQLYFPFRKFQKEMQPREVKNLFFAYDPTNSTYNLWEYVFTEPDDYETIDLVNSARFVIEYSKSPEPLKEYAVKPVKSGAIQANDIYKLMDLPMQVGAGNDDRHKIALQYAFDPRQSDYYQDGTEILGLTVKRNTRYVLTSLGEKYIKTTPEERARIFLRQLVEYAPVSEVVHRILAGEVITMSDLEDMVKRHDPLIHKQSVFHRRAGAMRSWFKWIADKTGYCQVDAHGISRLQTLNGYARAGA